MPHPVFIKNLLDPATLAIFRSLVGKLKNGPLTEQDPSTFGRQYCVNPQVLSEFHSSFTQLMSQTFNKPLKPSYSFLSMYFEGAGICPPHWDRPQCYATLDICIDQKQVWPLHVNDVDTRDPKTLTPDELRLVMENSVAYKLEPGDAIIYSGTHHTHWRKRIQPGNHCDLVFFHFVRENFSGSLLPSKDS